MQWTACEPETHHLSRATSPSTSDALIPDESHVLSCDFPELSHLQGHYVHSTLSRGNKPPHVLKPPHSQWSIQSPRAPKSPKCHPNLQETPNLPNDNQISKRHEIFKCHQIFKSHQISLVPPNLPRANKCSSATKFAMIHHISKSHIYNPQELPHDCSWSTEYTITCTSTR